MRDVRRLPAFESLVTDLGLVNYRRNHGFADGCRPDGDDFRCRPEH